MSRADCPVGGARLSPYGSGTVYLIARPFWPPPLRPGGMQYLTGAAFSWNPDKAQALRFTTRDEAEAWLACFPAQLEGGFVLWEQLAEPSQGVRP